MYTHSMYKQMYYCIGEQKGLTTELSIGAKPFRL